LSDAFLRLADIPKNIKNHANSMAHYENFIRVLEKYTPRLPGQTCRIRYGKESVFKMNKHIAPAPINRIYM
jgi:hypothetical protein